MIARLLDALTLISRTATRFHLTHQPERERQSAPLIAARSIALGGDNLIQHDHAIRMTEQRNHV